MAALYCAGRDRYHMSSLQGWRAATNRKYIYSGIYLCVVSARHAAQCLLVLPVCLRDFFFFCVQLLLHCSISVSIAGVKATAQKKSSRDSVVSLCEVCWRGCLLWQLNDRCSLLTFRSLRVTFSQRAPPAGCQQEQDAEEEKHVRKGRAVCFQSHCCKNSTFTEEEELLS